MSKNLSIDFINTNKNKSEIDNLLDQLLSGKAESVRIDNIISSTFTQLYEVEEVTDFNGWQCDWWSNLFYKGKRFNVFGCAWEGYVKISSEDEGNYFKDDDNNDDESIDEEIGEEISEYEDALKIDVYHDTDIVFCGKEHHGVLPVKDDVSIEEAEKLVDNCILHKYYAWRYSQGPYTLVYAPNKNSALDRMFAIWGEVNEIANEGEYLEKCEFYKNYPVQTRIKYSGIFYVLDWECPINLSKEETINFLEETGSIPRDNNKLRSDEIKEAVNKWKKEHGYAGKVINLDYKTVKEYLNNILDILK